MSKARSDLPDDFSPEVYEAAGTLIQLWETLPPERLGQRLKILRVIRELNQAAIGDLLGISQNGVSEIEKGVRPLTLARALKISETYGVPLSWFFADTAALPAAGRGAHPAGRVRRSRASSRDRDLGVESGVEIPVLKLVRSG